jgi:hypothetical protein
MDLIGFIEKLKHDKIHKSNVPSQKIDMYIQSIRYAFTVRYGKDMYNKIEYFREDYLLLTGTKMNTSDDIMSKQTYKRFMELLRLAEQKKIFDCSELNFEQESRDLILSTLPEGHESKRKV